MKARCACVRRVTRETRIQIRLNLDGAGRADIDSGLPFLNHMLELLTRHALVDLTLRAKGDLAVDDHHTVEDIGLSLGTAFDQALGARKSIARYGYAYVPMDEALSRVVVDLGGRPFLVYQIAARRRKIRTFDVKLINPWAGVGDWVPRLEARAKELSDAATSAAVYTSVVHDIDVIMQELAVVKDDKGPGVMNEEYVAYSRRKAENLRGLEGRLMRLEELFQPREKPLNLVAPMLSVEKPNKQTTWMIIYIILGFLAVVSLLFYVRWYGKSKAEKSEQTDNVKNG